MKSLAKQRKKQVWAQFFLIFLLKFDLNVIIEVSMLEASLSKE